MSAYRRSHSDAQQRRSLQQRMLVVHAILFFGGLIIVARLLELQILKGAEYHSSAQSQHYGGVVLPARRGEILSLNSKTGETSILATNTTLDLVYVDPDPLLIAGNPGFVAETLSNILVTEDAHRACMEGSDGCPRELVPFFKAAFDPLTQLRQWGSGTLLEPVPATLPVADRENLPDLPELRRLFARSIEEKIQDDRVRFVPLLYGATKVQMKQISDMNIPGVSVEWEGNLIHADPESIDQKRIQEISRTLSGPLDIDREALLTMLKRRPLRYVPIMRQLSPVLSSKIREAKIASLKETLRKRKGLSSKEADKIKDPLRSIALHPEHWRFYPDTTVASHVVGFLNTNQEAQYGIERTYDPQLRGQEGRITSVSDPSGGQIVTAQQKIIDPKDGDTVVLTIDRAIQKEVEGIMDKAVEYYQADSGQAIVIEPKTGKILAMVNAPLFDSNAYGGVYAKELLHIPPAKRKDIVVELYHPETNAFILKAYYDDVFTEEGKKRLSEETRKKLEEVSALFDLHDMARTYLYIGENNRREIFATPRPDVWLKYENNLGVGAYLNRTIQAVYEPGSVLKAVTMAIAIDQGEVTPNDRYNDKAPVKIDEYTIKNALNIYYGDVTMTNCLEFSINTCMTSVSAKLGRKLFYRMLERFGIGRITGIELEDELPGDLPPWRRWSNALLATAAYGQGLSATPLQVATAIAALANGGRLMKPTIVDRVIRSDGAADTTQPKVVDQVITEETSRTITAMLVSSVNRGYAKAAHIPGYKIAGKTGTSQIAGPGGRYESGTGSTIASFAGYAPADDPRFVIYVKFDRPRRVIHGATSAAPVFHDIAAFLFKYYGIPPEIRD